MYDFFFLCLLRGRICCNGSSDRILRRIGTILLIRGRATCLVGSQGLHLFLVLESLLHEQEVDALERVAAGLRASEVDYFIIRIRSYRERSVSYSPNGIAIKLKTRNQIQALKPTLGSAIAIGPANTVKKAISHWHETLSANPMWR